MPDVALCQACTRLGHCRLGLTTETLDDGGSLHCTLTCSADNEGGPGVAHGGWTAAVMDELLGHVILRQQSLAVTGTLTVRFVKPVPIGQPLRALSWVERRGSKTWEVSARLWLEVSGAELATAHAVMVLRDSGHFERHRVWLAEQQAANRSLPPTPPTAP